jgi:4-amino-4-deoxy-L-arabinose transferase-like glycosyltransferase
MVIRAKAVSPAWAMHHTVLTRSAVVIPAIIVVALLVRLAWLAVAYRTGLNPLGGDSNDYITIASNVLAGEGFRGPIGEPTAYRMPVYPLYLAGILTVFGTDPNIIGIIQAVLGAVTAGVTAATAWRLAGPVAGWTAGLTMATYPHVVTWTHFVLTETLFIFFAMLALWLLVEAQSRGSWPWFAWAGVALALGALTRTTLLPFIPIAAAAAWWLASGLIRWARAGFVLLAPAVLLGLWVIRNVLVLGAVTLSTQGPQVLWWGHTPDLVSYHRGGHAAAPPPPASVPPFATEVETAAIYSQAVRDHLTAHPFAVVENIAIHVWNMWRPVPDSYGVLPWLAFGGSYLLVLALGVVGFALTLRRPPQPGVRYVQGYVIALTLFHALTIGEIRLRMPIMPALVILAAVAVAYIASLLSLRTGGASNSRSTAGWNPSGAALSGIDSTEAA